MKTLTRVPHSSKLEKLFGKGQLQHISDQMKGWYGGPISVMGSPGLYVHPDGGFAYAQDPTKFERLQMYFQRVLREMNRVQFNAGFASMDALIAAATTATKRREFTFQKLGTTGAVGFTSSMFRCAGQPSAGAAAGAAPGGTVPTDATAGCFPFTNPAGGCEQRMANAMCYSTVATTLLFYDRIYACLKTMNSAAAEAVTGAPTRYQSIVSTDWDYVAGNFLFIEGSVALPATAHNHDAIQYLDQAGNAQTAPVLAGIASLPVNRLDHAGWFVPLAAGSTGIKALTSMKHSAAIASGAMDYVMGRPLAWFPLGVAAFMQAFDNINTMINLTRVADDAAIAILEVSKPTTTASSISGTVLTLETT